MLCEPCPDKMRLPSVYGRNSHSIIRCGNFNHYQTIRLKDALMSMFRVELERKAVIIVITITLLHYITTLLLLILIPHTVSAMIIWKQESLHISIFKGAVST